MTRDQAAAAVTAAAAERDGIQANLLDLDGSFGKRLLDGAPLTGESRRQWEAAAAQLATLWEVFTAYEAVINRAAALLTQSRRPTGEELAQITGLLTGPSVTVAKAPQPLGSRDLTDRGRSDLTLAAAVLAMRQAFDSVTSVVSAAETVWNQTADGLTEIETRLAAAREQAGEPADAELTAGLATAGADLSRLRDLLNSDPLALWQRGRTDSSLLDRLRGQAAAIAARAADIATLRAGSGARIAAARAAVLAAASAWQDATAATARAQAKIAGRVPGPPPEPADLSQRLAGLDPLRAAARWTRLAAELAAIEADAAAAARTCRDAERLAAGLLARRDELRGLLDAYQAKAAKLGGAEDAALAASYGRARDLLWTAPCDLAAAAAAVSGYQQAVLARTDRRQPR